MFQLPARVLRLISDHTAMDPATERDKRIARRLQDLFERELALTDLGGLQFFVHKGSVVLKGDLAFESDRTAVLDLIGSVPEVRRVVDHLAARAMAA